MSYFRPDLHRYFASQFVDSILHKKSTLYYFLGRTYPWERGTYTIWNDETQQYETVSVSDDTYPPLLPDDAYSNDTKIRDDITYVKKLESNNVTLSIRRINWKKDTVYHQWDSTKDMNELNKDKTLKTPYYILNSNYSVYKCLFNNHGSPSTVEPKEKSYGIIETGDGYLWKYMYSIPKIQLTRFLSNDYIPCQKAITESFYNLGAVESVVVRDGGMNYKNNSVVQAIVDSPKLIPCVINECTDDKKYAYRTLNTITVTSQGSDYSQSTTVRIVSSTGFGAELKPVITEGKITEIKILNGGRNYLSTDTIVFDDVEGLDKGAKATFTLFSYLSSLNLTDKTISDLEPREGLIYSVYKLNTSTSNYEETDERYRIDNPTKTYFRTLDKGLRAEISLNIDSEGSISSVNILKKGRGYDANTIPSIVIDDKYHTGRGKYTGNQSAVLVANIGGDSVDTITIVDPGIGYSNENTTKLTVIGDGSGCKVKPIIEGGKIKSVEIVNGGTGYTHARINVVTEKEKGVDYGNVDLIAVLGGNSISTDQGVVEQTTINGAIYAAEVTNGGYGYSLDGCSATIVGDGEGFACRPIVVNGGIHSIKINDGGYGYTNNDYVLVEDSSGSGSGCKLSVSVDENGTIEKINVDDCGKGYNQETTTIKVISDGEVETCSLSPIVKNGVVRYIDVDSYGKKYTRGEILITDSHYRDIPEEELEEATATAYPLISPIGGHGSNAVSELNACAATVYLALRYSDSFGTLGQEFRQFGVLSGLTSYKNLISNVYGVPVILNDTNWLFNSKDGLISQKLLEPVVSVYDPSDPTDDGAQFSITKSKSLTNTTVKNHIDYVNVDNAGNGYLSYPMTTATVTDSSGKGSGCNLIPYIKGSINSVDVISGGHGFQTTTVKVFDKDGNVDNDTFIRLSISNKGEVLSGTVFYSSNKHEAGKSRLEIISKRDPAEPEQNNAKISPVVENGKITSITVDQHGKNYKFTDIFVKDKTHNGSIVEYDYMVDFPTKGETGKVYIDLSENKAYYWEWTTSEKTTGNYVEIENYSTYLALITPNITDGIIYNVQVRQGGKGYDNTTTLTVEDEEGSSGSGAVLTPVIVDGRISSVTIVNGGSGYSSKAKIIVNGTGSDAELLPQIHDGVLTSVNLLNGGLNYIEKSTYLSINSNISYFGNQYEDPTFLVGFKGSIDSILVYDSGSNYTEKKTTIQIKDEQEIPTGSGATATPIISSNESTEVCLVPLNETSENYTINPGYAVKYTNEDKVSIYKIVDVLDKYIPIKNKSETNIVTSEENLCSVITLKNYNYITNSYPGLSENCDVLMTIDHVSENKTSNLTEYRVINVSGNQVLVQPLTFIPREISGENDTLDGDTVSYSYNDGQQTQFVSTTVSKVISNCTIDKYSGNLLYVANMRPLEFFEGKVAAVRTNIYF